MSEYLCITIRFLQPYCHARRDQGQPEWPPSPLRLFQALAAGAAAHWNERIELKTARAALEWLEQQPIGRIVAPPGTPSDSKHRLYVPDNVGDKVAGSWSRGGTASIADHRTEKDVLPIHVDGEDVHYLWALADGNCPHLDILRTAARAVTHLGWGIDVVTGEAEILSEEEAAKLSGTSWATSSSAQGIPLRIAVPGTFGDLMRKHHEFLNRLGKDERGSDSFRPVGPLTAFEVVPFRASTDPQTHPTAVFELRRNDGQFFFYPQRKLIHIAGMVRHLAIELMRHSPPRGIEDVDQWVDRFVAGHRDKSRDKHRQFSYLPLPSIGHRHADQGIRRVMISAPPGTDAWLEHLAGRLAGQQLERENGSEFGEQGSPTLVRVRNDTVAKRYTRSANRWASVTPVILPGHDDHKPAKTRKLIETALAQAGIEQPCEFGYSAFSRFRKSFSAHKYGRDKRPQGHFRPDHLSTQTAVHLTLMFNEEVKVPGPLVIGAGRHCGLGLMAALGDRQT